MKLEELARQSSTAARVSVAQLEAPPVGADTPNRAWMPITAGVAVTALVVGGLVVLARDSSDPATSSNSVLPTVPEVPRLGLQLDDWSVTFAGSFEDLSAGSGRPAISYYGDAGSDDPFSGGDLLIVAAAGADPSSQSPQAPGGDTIRLRGTQATVSSSTDQGLPDDAISVTWYEIDANGDTTEIVLVSRSFDLEQLTAVAEQLTIDAGTVTPGIDFELDRLATAAGTPFDVLSGSGEGYLVGYTNQDMTDFAVISSGRGALAQEAIVLRWWTDQVDVIEVDGRPGFLATFDESLAAVGPTLSWSPIDGIVATVSHLGADDSLDLAALAATAYELDDATWADYLAATDMNRANSDEYDEVFGEGDGSSGGTDYSWVLGLQSGNLCFTVAIGNESIGTCQERGSIDVPPGGARTIDNNFGAVLAQVVIAADPAVDEIVETQGGYGLTRVEADGLSWFVAIGDTKFQPSFDVIVDGAVVDTLGADVEAVAEMEPALTANPAAVELGITDMAILAADSSDAEFSWWLGRNGPDLCLVTDGRSPTAHCSAPGDVVVFAPVAAPGRDVTIVVVVDPPRCVETIGFDGAIVEFSTGAADELNTYEVFGTTDRTEASRLRLDVGGEAQFVDLPVTEGTAPLPAQLCDRP